LLGAPKTSALSEVFGYTGSISTKTDATRASSKLSKSFLGILDGTIGTTEARWRHFPDSMTIKTSIIVEVGLLQTFIIAVGTYAASIKPIAIGIKTVLEVVLVDDDVKLTSEYLCILPCCNF
jgi:hypothetical protein